jgi:H+-transporting ATPase
VVIGLLMTIESFGILFIGLDRFRLSADTRALSTFCFEILLFFAIFSIFMVREKRHFWQSAPSKTLLFLLIGDFVLGVILSSSGLLGFKPIPITQTLAVFAYTAVFSFIVNDIVKVFLFKKWPPEIP